MARDLFDHQSDSDENFNISNNPENGELIDDLSKLLARGKGWKNISKKL